MYHMFVHVVSGVINPHLKMLNVQESQKTYLVDGTAFFFTSTVALSLRIEIYNSDMTTSSFLATSLYEKVIFTKN